VGKTQKEIQRQKELGVCYYVLSGSIDTYLFDCLNNTTICSDIKDDLLLRFFKRYDKDIVLSLMRNSGLPVEQSFSLLIGGEFFLAFNAIQDLRNVLCLVTSHHRSKPSVVEV